MKGSARAQRSSDLVHRKGEMERKTKTRCGWRKVKAAKKVSRETNVYACACAPAIIHPPIESEGHTHRETREGDRQNHSGSVRPSPGDVFKDDTRVSVVKLSSCL